MGMLIKNQNVYGKGIGNIHNQYEPPRQQPMQDTTSWLKPARTPEPKPWMHGHAAPPRHKPSGPEKPFNEKHHAPIKGEPAPIPMMNSHIKEPLQQNFAGNAASMLTSPKQIILKQKEDLFKQGLEYKARQASPAKINESASMPNLPMQRQQEALYG